MINLRQKVLQGSNGDKSLPCAFNNDNKAQVVEEYIHIRGRMESRRRRRNGGAEAQAIDAMKPFYKVGLRVQVPLCAFYFLSRCIEGIFANPTAPEIWITVPYRKHKMHNMSDLNTDSYFRETIHHTTNHISINQDVNESIDFFEYEVCHAR